jgi:hypothetical protein
MHGNITPQPVRSERRRPTGSSRRCGSVAKLYVATDTSPPRLGEPSLHQHKPDASRRRAKRSTENASSGGCVPANGGTTWLPRQKHLASPRGRGDHPRRAGSSALERTLDKREVGRFNSSPGPPRFCVTVMDIGPSFGRHFFVSPLEWDTCRWIAILRNKMEHSLEFGGVSV